MKKLILGLTLVALILPMTAAADEGPWREWMNNTIEETPVRGQTDLVGIIFRAIQYILAFLGVVAVVVILIGGFMWMTAGGNDEKVSKAKVVSDLLNAHGITTNDIKNLTYWRLGNDL